VVSTTGRAADVAGVAAASSDKANNIAVQLTGAVPNRKGKRQTIERIARSNVRFRHRSDLDMNFHAAAGRNAEWLRCEGYAPNKARSHMRLASPLVRLPIRFDARALALEVEPMPGSAWMPHPTGYAGNDAALLVTPGGRLDQGFLGAMAATENLARTPYVRQVMAALGSTWGRSRLMRLAPAARVAPHIDTHYYWWTHWRLHIPVVTSPEVLFTCGGDTVHMAAGECWLFDSFQRHEVHNGGQRDRVHLVLDTVGGGRLWDLLSRAQAKSNSAPEFVAPDGGDHHPQIERFNVPDVMTPWEIRCHVGDLLLYCTPSAVLPQVRARLDRFIDLWAAAWAANGDRPDLHPHYLQLVLETRDDVLRLGAETIRLTNGLTLMQCLREIVFRMAVRRPEQVTFPGQGEQPRMMR
jgi:hypothetical protein